jgi:hypothetical protein
LVNAERDDLLIVDLITPSGCGSARLDVLERVRLVADSKETTHNRWKAD